MKILLVKSFSGHNLDAVFPIGLSYIAGALDGHEVRALDTNVEQDHLVKLETIMQEFCPDVVGIMIRNIWPFRYGSNLSPYYKDGIIPIIKIIKSSGSARLVIGGPGFTAYSREIMEDLPEVELGVFREGEDTFKELVGNLDSPDKVKGVYYRKDGKVNFTGAREFKSVEELPMPKWDVFDVDKYKDLFGSMGVQTKRGCALKCAYCVYPYLCGYKISSRPAVKVVDEIEYLSNRYGIKDIVFVDTIFNVPHKHAVEICNELSERKLGVAWTAWFHPKHITEEFVRQAVDAGCYLFEFSPDAYSDKMLRLLHKNIKKQDIIKTYKIIKKTEGANIAYNFFFNGPGANILTFIQLLFFYLRVRIFLGPKLKRFFFSRLHIEPNTELCSLALEKGMIDKNTKFLGSQEIYRKLIYRESALVDLVFAARNRIKSIRKKTMCRIKNLFNKSGQS